MEKGRLIMTMHEEFEMQVETLTNGNIGTFKAYCKALNKKGVLMFVEFLMSSHSVTSDARLLSLRHLYGSAE